MNSNSEIDISVVVPIFNEEECVRKLFEKIKTEMEKLPYTYEILLVDDGSTDRTRDILHEIKAKEPNLKVVLFRKNYGQTPAMVAGFDHAIGKVIVTMDGDLQNDPADIQKLMDKMKEGYEIVSGWRYKRKDKMITRKIPSMCANKLISILTGVQLHDYGCSLKAYKAECIRSVNAYAEMHRFFPAMASITGARTAEIPVNHYAREFGKSKYGISRTFKVFADLFTIFMITKFSSKPGVLFAMFGVPFFVLANIFLCAIVMSLGKSSHVVLFGASMLFFILTIHFVMLSALSMLILRKGKYKAAKLSSITANIIQ